MPRSIRSVLLNPLFLVPPLIALFLLGWQAYLYSSRNLTNAQGNILLEGGFDTLDGRGLPKRWQLVKSGDVHYTTEQTKAYASGKAFRLTVDDYKNGDITLVSPKTSLQAHTTYLYKGYYITTVNVELLARYYYADGTSRLELLNRYPVGNDQWSTVAAAFKTSDSIRAVQFAYRLTGKGSLTLDDTYLTQKNNGAYVAATQSPTKNLVPNPNLSPGSNDAPLRWSKYQAGTNNTTFSLVRAGDHSPYARVVVSDYQNGEAKWQYPPQNVTPGQYFAFGVDYQSSTPAEVVAEYELEDGKRLFRTVQTLRPAGEWTHATARFETPPGVKNMFVTVVLHGNGTLNTTHYELFDLTKPGPKHFKRPLVSLVFDDGWRSDYGEAAPLLEQYDYRGTFYLNPATIDTDIFMNSQQISDLKNRGHQLASHGYEHVDMTAQGAQQLDNQLKLAANYIREETTAKKIDFASPYGRTDPEVQSYLRTYYRSHRSTDDGINTKQTFDPYNLKVLFVGNDMPIETIRQTLAETKTTNGWLIVLYHKIENPATNKMTITPLTFAQQLEAIRQSGIKVTTVANALDELQPQ